MTISNQIKYYQVTKDVFEHLGKVHSKIDASGFNKSLSHLIMLRVSQINGCAYCVKLHTRDAREDGETNERIDNLTVWQHVNNYSESEKAALAWAEALTNLDKASTYYELRELLRDHYSDTEIGALTAIVGMINLWNRVQISNY